MARTAGACTALAFLLAAAAACEPQPVQEGAREQAPEVAPAPTPAPARGAAQLSVRQKEGLGTYLTDASGRSLYVFLADTAAAPGGQRASTCYDACAQAWPPLLSEGEPVAADPAVREAMLGTVERRDGASQVTYNGWPLYYYARDANPGDTNGQDVEGFGAEWYLVSPDGNPLRREAGGGR